MTTQKNATRQFEELFSTYEADDDFLVNIVKLRVAELLASQMEDKGLTASELARKLGKSRAYVSKLRTGSENLTLESLVRIARALDCRLDVTFQPNRRGSLRSARNVRRRAG